MFDASLRLILSFALTASLFATNARALPRVAVLAASAGGSDVQTKLANTGAFSAVDVINVSSSTPNTAALQIYDAVLVFSGAAFANPVGMGDNLATYLEGGGGVLVFDFEALENGAAALGGRFGSTYTLMTSQPANMIETNVSALGTIADPNSPLVANVAAFTCKKNPCHHLTSATKNNAVVVAAWADGNPLILRGSANGHALVELNFYPVSDSVANGEWDATTDGATMIKNALLYAVPSALRSTKNMQSFTDTAVGQSSGITVTYTNTGATPLTISALTMVGSNPGDFSAQASAVLPQKIAPGGSFDVAVYFTPGAAGARSGVVSATVAGAANTVETALSGLGLAPGLAASPSVVAFGGVAGGATGKKTVTLTNNSMAAITVNTSTITQDNKEFSITPSFALPVTLPAGATFDFTVSFTPAAAGVHFGLASVTIAGGNPLVLPMNGWSGPAAITIGNNSVLFGNAHVGAASPLVQLTINNTGYSDLHVTSVTSSGANAADFSFPNIVVPATVGSGQTFTYQAQFRPMAVGNRSAVFTVTSDDQNAGTLSFTALGTGVAFLESLAPGNLDFGTVNVGSTSMPMSTTITNGSKAALTIKKVTITGPQAGLFAMKSPPAPNAQVSPLGALSLKLSYTPLMAAPAHATLTILVDDPNAPAFSVPLTGQGTGGMIAIAPASLDFGRVPFGKVTDPKMVNVNNIGGAPLTLSAVTVSGMAFSSPDMLNLPAVIAPGGTLGFSVVFNPALIGVANGAVSIVSDDPGAPMAEVPLTGIGTQSKVSVSPLVVDFGVTIVGAPSISVPLVITNTGDQPLALGSVKLTGDGATSFVLEGNTMLPQTLAIGDATSVKVHFAAISAGTFAASVLVTGADAGVMAITALKAVAVTNVVSLSTMSVDFGNVTLGGSVASMPVMVKNTTGGDVTLTLPVSSSPLYTLDTTGMALTLPANGQTSFIVRFTPTTAGAATGKVDIAFAALPNRPVATLELTGHGVAPAVVVPPTPKGGCSVVPRRARGAHESPLPLMMVLGVLGLLAARRRAGRQSQAPG